jgi:transposase
MEKLKELGVQTIDPPPNSPDLNPIENGWTELSRLVYNIHSSFQTVNEMKEELTKAWEELPMDYVNRLCESEPKRIFAVNKVQGSVSDY